MAGVAVAFDTLKAATRLQKEAGFDETQAHVLVSTFAEGMVENLATKDDISVLKGDISVLRGDIAVLRRETKADIAALSREMATLATKEELATLRGEMHEMSATLRGDMHEMSATLRGEMHEMSATLRGEMHEMSATLRGEMSKVQERLTVRLGAVIAAAVAILVAVDKLL